jgi:TRAP-type C4-dicarboxylate transport system substrate-binding protein
VKRFFVLSLILALIGCGDSTDDKAEIKWDMPTPFGETVFHTLNILQFADEIKTATQGKVAIRVHSGASLYKHPEIKRAVRSGQIPIGEVLISLAGNENPLYQIDVLPLLATSYEQAEILWQISRTEIEKVLEEQGLKLLFAVPWPPQGFYVNKEINSIDDIKGLKIRAYNAMLSRLVELMGGIPTTVQTPEIPQAFSTGVIDSMMTSPSTGVSSQAWDYVTHYYDFQAWLPKDMVIVNKETFEKLPTDVQAIIMEAAGKAEKRGWLMSKHETAEKTKTLVDNGILVSPPSEKLKKGLTHIRQQMVKEWLEQGNETSKKILDAYYKAVGSEL